MKRTKCLCLFLVLALAGNVAFGDDDGDKQVPAGAVAFFFLARISFFAPPTPPVLVGYMPFIEGIPGPLFNGPAGEATAHFTLRLDSGFGSTPVFLSPGSNVSVIFNPPGARFSVYFDQTPNQDWADPDSFSDGKLIAQFEESAFLSTSVIEPDGSGVSYNLFSSALIHSKPFRFNGKRYDFKKLMRHGVTTNNVSSTTPVSFVPFTQAFTGSAVAIGGNEDD